MGQALLLVFDYINVTCIRTEKAILKVCEELDDLLAEYTGNKIWPIRRLLSGK